MRFISTRAHGMIDYIWGLLVGTAPWIFNFTDNRPATYVAWIMGVGAILYSLLTDYELGLVPVLSMPMHLVIDGLGGAFLAVSPWLFGFADRVFWPHLLFGLFAVGSSLMTETRSTSPDRIASERI